jgi:signal transduction histidine kinase
MARLSSLRVRLLLLVALVVLPALGLIFYTGWEQRRRAALDAYENAFRLLRLASRNEEELIQDGRDLLVGLAQLSVVRSRDSGACNSLFARLLKQYPRYSNIGAADSEGNVFCSAVPSIEPVNVRASPGFLQPLQVRDFTVGTYQISRITGTAILPLQYPILDPAGRVRVVIFAGLDLGWLNGFAAKAELPPGSTLTLVDRNGTILVWHPNPERWVGKPAPQTSFIRTILGEQTDSTAEAAGLDGILRLYASSPLRRATGAADAYLSIGIPAQVAFAEVDRILKRNLAGLGLVAVLTVVAAWVGGDLFIVRRVNALIGAANRLQAGDLGARAGLPSGGGELHQLARAFDEMAASLETREAEDKCARERLQEYAERLRTLARRLVEVQESERREIARELHDGVGQSLTALGINLNLLRGHLPAEARAGAEARLADSLQLVEQTVGSIRALMAELRPPVLDDYGLLAALRWYGEQVTGRAGLPVEVRGQEKAPRLPSATETVLFRIAQEALTNVVKHAQATRATVTVEETADRVRLTIADDGVGFDPAALPPLREPRGWGLLTMQERAEAVGGRFRVEAAPGQGTRVVVEVSR